MVNLCLTIGISNTSQLEKLPGAITAANDVGQWAQQAGFQTAIITDQTSPVTISIIKDALLALLPKNDSVDVFILHFAGHGYRTGAEQNVWLPSDWFEEGCAISVEGLKRGLLGRSIRNLSIFSDACRGVPRSKKMADIVQHSVLVEGDDKVNRTVIDRFSAAMDGELTYMLKGHSGSLPRCIFSTVLLEGLYGIREEAFDKLSPDCVIPESLALFTDLRMQEISTLYGLTCMPEYATGLPRDHVIYLNKQNQSPHSLPSFTWPPPPSAVQIAQDVSNRSYGSVNQSGSYYQSHGVEKLANRVEGAFAGLRPHSTINLIIFGLGIPVKVWSSTNTQRINLRSFSVDVNAREATQILVEFSGKVFMSAIVYPGLITLLTQHYYDFSGWICMSKTAAKKKDIANVSNFCYAFNAGNIRASQVESIATELRRNKHLNPMMGAISAYLYDFNGDIDSIRRMAFFYCEYEQAIPYDIALMSMLNEFSPGRNHVKIPAVSSRYNTHFSLPIWVSRSTPETSGVVAGYWPWLKQGWQFINKNGHLDNKKRFILKQLIPHLLPSECSSFDQYGAELLIDHFNLESDN